MDLSNKIIDGTPSKNMNGTFSKFNYVKSSGYGKQSNSKNYPNPNNPYSGGMRFQNGNIIIQNQEHVPEDMMAVTPQYVKHH